MLANQVGFDGQICCGLLKVIKGDSWEPPTKFPIPLISVNVNASVVHAVAQVEITQIYVNKENQPIEAIYYFPTNPDGAVTLFQAELEGRVIKGIVKPTSEAKKDYDKAVAAKRTAFLGEETTADIFKLRVGFLKPGSQVKVIIGYVTEVKNEPGTNNIRFYIPTTIAPRYVSPSESGSRAKDIRNMKFSSASPAPLSIKVVVSLQGGIKLVKSPTHKVATYKVGNTAPRKLGWDQVLAELSTNVTDMDRDFVLYIEPEEVHKPTLYSEKLEDGSTACMVHLIPSFKLEEQKTELIFLLDRSGSMQGSSIELARKALVLLLHSMPADCYFNVVGFGSSYRLQFPQSIKYNKDSLSEAIHHARRMEADLGGTEIFEPLQYIYEQRGIKGYLRQLFVITDGEVSDTDRVLGIAQANANNVRVFALGIGDGASHHLVEGLAKAGGGTSAFVTYKEGIDKKVLNQLKNALQPSLTDIELKWEGVTPPVDPATGPTVQLNKEKTLLGYNKPIEQPFSPEAARTWNKQSPKNIPPVYDGSQMVVFGVFKDGCPTGVTIKAQSPDGPLTLNLKNASAIAVGQMGMLHQLAAIKLVRELELQEAGLQYQGNYYKKNEMKEGLVMEIVAISCENGITSKYTSFVAIDPAEGKHCEKDWVMESRHIPSQFAHGWHGIGGLSAACADDSDEDDDNVCALDLTDDSDDGNGARECMNVGRRAPLSMHHARAGYLCSSMDSSPSPPPTRFGRRSSSVEIDGRISATGARSRKLPIPPSAGGCRRASASFISSAAAAGPLPANPAAPLAKRPLATFFQRRDTNTKTEFVAADSPVMQLIQLQSYDGSYTLSRDLAFIFGKSLEAIKREARKYSWPEDAFATALAISFFRTQMKEEKELWELVVLKAKIWLDKKMSFDTAERVVLAATGFLIGA